MTQASWARVIAHKDWKTCSLRKFEAMIRKAMYQ